MFHPGSMASTGGMGGRSARRGGLPHTRARAAVVPTSPPAPSTPRPQAPPHPRLWRSPPPMEGSGPGFPSYFPSLRLRASSAGRRSSSEPSLGPAARVRSKGGSSRAAHPGGAPSPRPYGAAPPRLPKSCWQFACAGSPRPTDAPRAGSWEKSCGSTDPCGRSSARLPPSNPALWLGNAQTSPDQPAAQHLPRALQPPRTMMPAGEEPADGDRPSPLPMEGG